MIFILFREILLQGIIIFLSVICLCAFMYAEKGTKEYWGFLPRFLFIILLTY